VTGSSRGIGRAVAHTLAVAGAAVALHGPTPTSIRAFGEGDSLEAAADEMARDTGARILPFPGDLTDDAVVRRLAAEIEAALGPIDILVTCVGGDIGARGVSAPLAGKPESNDAVFVSLEDLRAVLDRNLMSCILCCRAVAPGMMARRSGRIVTFGSIAGAFGHAASAIYSTAKAAVHEYTRCLADQLRPNAVPVNAVPPEVARVVEFLVSEPAGYISGQVIRVDGAKQLFPV